MNFIGMSQVIGNIGEFVDAIAVVIESRLSRFS